MKTLKCDLPDGSSDVDAVGNGWLEDLTNGTTAEMADLTVGADHKPETLT